MYAQWMLQNSHWTRGEMVHTGIKHQPQKCSMQINGRLAQLHRASMLKYISKVLACCAGQQQITCQTGLWVTTNSLTCQCSKCAHSAMHCTLTVQCVEQFKNCIGQTRHSVLSRPTVWHSAPQCSSSFTVHSSQKRQLTVFSAVSCWTQSQNFGVRCAVHCCSIHLRAWL